MVVSMPGEPVFSRPAPQFMLSCRLQDHEPFGTVITGLLEFGDLFIRQREFFLLLENPEVATDFLDDLEREDDIGTIDLEAEGFFRQFKTQGFHECSRYRIVVHVVGFAHF